MVSKSLFINLLFSFLLTASLLAQKKIIDVQRIEPAFWWTGMKNKELQLLVYGKNIAASTAAIKYDGVTIQKIERTENPNYQFIYINIDSKTKPGIFTITFQAGKATKTITYELKHREKSGEDFKGFNSSDVIYLVMPDRFANGDEANDWIPRMRETPNRAELFSRHGGDLKGIENNLHYIKELGATAIWLNPVQENDQPKESYHGYAITDFYKIDARLGTNESYKVLVTKVHEMKMKMIMDLVVNHSGNENWFIKDLPSKDWIHQFTEFNRSNYRLSTTIDPYASKFDINKMEQGWFDEHMPDLNQHNPLLATYLIQNSIWWIEYAQLDGIRMDTHPYPYKDFMARWCKEIMTEYPNLNIVGEIWEDRVLLTSYFQTDSRNPDGYHGNLPSATDFPLKSALNISFNERDSWDEGLARIYYTLIQDFAYSNANNNVTFLDNHDLTRFATSVGNDLNKQKMAYAALFTLRGIPQIFYGGEIGMTGESTSRNEKVRNDMPGGWKEDAQNAFTAAGRTAEQNELFNYIKTLLIWRKNKPVIHQGSLMHFIPEDGIYVYFRYNDTESVMVTLNNNTEPKTLNTKRFAERLTGFTSGKNIVTSQTVSNLQNLTLPPKSATILELRK